MSEIKRLWSNKHTPQGRIDITVFFINIFLLLSHTFLMLVYITIGHKLMTWFSIITLFIYIFSIFNCYKNVERYIGIAFLEIWLHLIFGILSFGWRPCYQNWCFGMIVAYFLPAFSSNKATRRPFIYAFVIMFTYFFMATLYPLVDLDFTMGLDIYENSILFIANNLFIFITTILFALFYTSRSNRKELELSRKADYDELTDLYNRHAINQLGTKLINQAKEKNESYYFAILDIDHFKKINDTYGHSSGDLVLKKIASIIRTYSVRGIIPGRWGGEEFVMLAPHHIEYSEFTKILEKLRIKVSETEFNIENDQKINLTISIGSAKIKEYKNIEESIADADINLYKAKETGRNKLVK